MSEQSFLHNYLRTKTLGFWFHSKFFEESFHPPSSGSSPSSFAFIFVVYIFFLRMSHTGRQASIPSSKLAEPQGTSLSTQIPFYPPLLPPPPPLLLLPVLLLEAIDTNRNKTIFFQNSIVLVFGQNSKIITCKTNV